MKTVVQCVNKRFDYIYNEVERNAKIDAVYSIDNEKKGALKTFLQMSKDYKYSEYKLHLQDDIVIADNLKDYLPKLEAYMKNKEIHLLSLFAPNRKLILQQYKEGKTIVPFPNYLWLQASIFSPRLQQIMSKEADIYNEDTFNGADTFVAYVLNKHKIKAYVHLPSLVQHDTSIKSTLGHANSKIRESKVFDKNYITNLKN
tara:strand:- start:379 stop:981 length:603 start_codon:yes stop_codon:yes gene_type:complete